VVSAWDDNRDVSPSSGRSGCAKRRRPDWQDRGCLQRVAMMLRRVTCKHESVLVGPQRKIVECAGLGAPARRRSHASGRIRCSEHTPDRHRKMANPAYLTRKAAREPPRPATLQAGPRCLPRQARRAATQAGFAVLEKRTLGASERDEFLRAAFREMVISSIEPDRLVFVDECSSNTSLAPLYGWARKGERAHQKAPHGNRRSTATTR
jgi:hypothetical protein